MELFEAHHQWATRPADQRFNSLDEMFDATHAYASQAAEAVMPWDRLNVETDGDDLAIVGPSGTPAKLTHYSFGQLASRAEAPASYLRGLPAGLAAENIRHGLASKGSDSQAQLLLHRNGDLVLRAITGDAYTRIWNHEIIDRLRDVSGPFGLVPARQTMTWDGSPLPPEEQRAPALYASDHDMFVFLMTPDRPITDPTGQPLFRGVITVNSEVGDCSLKVLGFYFRDICQNHIVWGATQLDEIKLTHVGQIRRRWLEATWGIRRYLESSTAQDASKLRELGVRIAGTKEEVLDALFGKRSLGLTRKALTASYDAVIPDQDGDPRTVWGIAQGITRYSQTVPYADERTSLDRAAGKLLAMSF